ncbi:hypothetical protein [Anaeromyxobacter sp. Fw109-5]|uniref:hypothetical protein n=1 Tax=Anaeromyxobacter sp. (strain Fw109-5) TaxID=404589 RepID=UPI0000ED8147|nr:hypothetical protein [Anaeromyxobacter sp. Fw109-5]ABS25274.1 hypothetical protein Anae109_1066 [Anaeromyxobacter sp. Fw109-5]
MNLNQLVVVVAMAALSMTTTSCNDRHPKYTIGGTVTGLHGSTLVLHSNLGEDLSITADGPFAFSVRAVDGTPYEVTATQQPTTPPQLCSVTGGDDGHGSGTVHGGNVMSLVVRCELVATKYTIGGTVTGLHGSTLVLHSNLGEDLSITADGPFAFSVRAADGTPYEVTAAQQPTTPPQLCSVTGGDDGHGGGTVHGGDVMSLVVGCELAATVVQRWQAPVTWGPVWQDDGHMVQHAYFGSADGNATDILEQTGIGWELVNGPLPPPKRFEGFPSRTRWGAGPFNGTRYQATVGDDALDLPRDMLVCAIVKPDYDPTYLGDTMEKPIVAKGFALGQQPEPGGGWVLMQMHAQFCFHYEWLDETNTSRMSMAYTPTFFADQNIPDNGPLNPSYVAICAGRSGNDIRIGANNVVATDFNMHHLGDGAIVLDSSGGHRATIGGYDTGTDHVFGGRIYEIAVWDEPATRENIQAKLAVLGLGLGAGDPAVPAYTRNREGPFIGRDGQYHSTWRHGPRIDPTKGFLFGLQGWNRASYCTTDEGAPVACTDPTATLVVAAGEALDLWTAGAGATVQKDQLEPPGDSERPSAELVELSPGASLSTALGAFDSPGVVHGQIWIRVPAATTGRIVLATSNPAVVGGVRGTSEHVVDLGTLAPNVWTRVWLKELTTDGASGTLTLSAAANNQAPVAFYAWGADLTQIGGGGDLGAFDPGPAMYDWSAPAPRAAGARIGQLYRVQDDPEYLIDVLELPPVPVSTASTGFCLSVDAQPSEGLGWEAPFVNPRGLVAWLNEQQRSTAQLYATGGPSSELCFWVTGASGPTCWRPTWSAGSKHNLKGCVSSTGQMRLFADDVQVGSTVSGVAPAPDLLGGHVAIGNNAGADPGTWSFAGLPSPWSGFVSKVLVCSDDGEGASVATCR